MVIRLPPYGPGYSLQVLALICLSKFKLPIAAGFSLLSLAELNRKINILKIMSPLQGFYSILRFIY
jgi:hypothetical protein